MKILAAFYVAMVNWISSFNFNYDDWNIIFWKLVPVRGDPSSIDEFPDSSNETDTLFPIVDTSQFCTSSCDTQQQQHCAEIVQRYQTEPEEAVGLPTDTKDDEYQIHRHVVLLLVLSFSMFVVSLSANFYK